MNVNIVTVYQSPNYGSFLQAWALSEQLGEKYPVYLVDANVRNPLKNMYVPSLKCILKGVISGNFKYARYNWQRLCTSKKAFSKVRQISLQKARGCFIFGSDEIWNLSRKEMASYPVLWGKGIEAKGKLSYAPSINNCTAELIEESGLVSEVKTFDAISTRDRYSQEVIAHLVGRTVQKVVDPTMLISKDVYRKQFTIAPRSNYIAIYLFRPSNELIMQIKAIAKKLNKKLISVGNWAEWCDESVVCLNPFTYYLDADYVITNTFHGTAFAINMEKQFITFAGSMRKISELLEDYDLSERNATGLSGAEMEKLLFEPISFEHIRETLEENRNFSKAYLFDTLKQIEEKYYD